MTFFVNQNPTYSNSEQNDDEIRVILLGITGGGKSSTGNSILNFKRFIAKTESKSTTRACQVGYRKYNEQHFVVVDTPGFFDNKDSTKEETCRKIGQSLQITAPGPHAFLIVLPFGKVTPEVKKSWEWISEIFGWRALEYCIVIFTCLDNLEYDEGTEQGFIDNAIPELKELLIKCDMRYVSFNNRLSGTDPKTIESITKLLNYVRIILQKNENEVFKNEEIRKITTFLNTHQLGRNDMVSEDGTVVLLPQIEKLVMDVYMRKSWISN